MEEVKVLKLINESGNGKEVSADHEMIYQIFKDEFITRCIDFELSCCGDYLLIDNSDLESVNQIIEEKNLTGAVGIYDFYCVEHEDYNFLSAYEESNEIAEEYFESLNGVVFMDYCDAMYYEDFLSRATEFIEATSELSEEERDAMLYHFY